MTDIVQLLRELAECKHSDLSVASDGADEITALRAENENLRAALEKLSCKCPSNCDWEKHGDICPSWVARAALTQPAQPAPSAWRPIKTAPLDQTTFIAWNGHWRGVARFYPPSHPDDPMWVDETTEYIEPPPTHWLPLPPPPEKDMKDE